MSATASPLEQGQHTFSEPPAHPWTYFTRRMFERVLVYDLIENGAASTALLQGRLAYTEIPLPNGEATALIEWARQRNLISPLGHSERADGSPITEPEWTPTEIGRKLSPPISYEQIRGGALGWRGMKRVAKWVLLAVGIVGSAALYTGLHHSVGNVVALLVFVVPLLYVLTDYATTRWARFMDHVVVGGWPHYNALASRRQDQLRQLRSCRKLRAFLRRSHVAFPEYLQMRALVIMK